MAKNSTFPSMFSDVVDFHTEVLQLPTPTTLGLRSQEWVLERYRFLNEEISEFYDCAHASDMVGAIDGLLDTVYVALGTLYLMGFNEEQVQGFWDAIQKANMAKRPGRTKRGNLIDAVKPPDWVGPEQEIANIIKEALDDKT